MPVYKEKNGTWRVNYRYTDWTGELKQSTRRGFATRREAVAWEHEQSVKKRASYPIPMAVIFTADRMRRA